MTTVTLPTLPKFDESYYEQPSKDMLRGGTFDLEYLLSHLSIDSDSFTATHHSRHQEYCDKRVWFVSELEQTQANGPIHFLVTGMEYCYSVDIWANCLVVQTYSTSVDVEAELLSTSFSVSRHQVNQALHRISWDHHLYMTYAFVLMHELAG